MRPILLLVLFAAPAAAGPKIRWIDRTGGVREASISAVVSEGAREIKVEGTDGKVFAVPVRQLLSLIREDDTDAEQRALLKARGAAYFGGDVDEARATCDRLMKTGKTKWIREYATAHRAILAVRASEKDAKKRVLAFLDEYPNSRFKGRMIHARAVLHTREAKTGGDVQHTLELAFEDVMYFKGPLIVAFDCLVERARLYVFGDWRSVGTFAQGIRERFERELSAKKPDGALSTAIECAMIRIAMEWHEHRYLKALQLEKKPFGALAGVIELRRKAEFLLPELRSDVARLLGRIQKACGDEKAAKAAFDEALKLAPDPWRRARAARR